MKPLTPIDLAALSDADRAALGRIRKTYPRLDTWRARGRDAETPEKGSELFIDASIWPHHPPFEVARQSLVSATQHLNLARTAIEASDIYPTAHFTVLRGALVGAAQAVWLLDSDSRNERQQRALRVIYEWYRRLGQYDKELESEDLSDLDRAKVSARIRHSEERKQQARALWGETETVGENSELEVGLVVKAAAAAVFSDTQQLRAINRIWRATSGDAHALGWQLATRARNWSRGGDGFAVASVGGNLWDVAEPFIASFRLLKHGWSRFDQRAEGTG